MTFTSTSCYTTEEMFRWKIAQMDHNYIFRWHALKKQQLRKQLITLCTDKPFFKSNTEDFKLGLCKAVGCFCGGHFLGHQLS